MKKRVHIDKSPCLSRGAKSTLSRSSDPKNSRYGDIGLGKQGQPILRPITLPNADAFARLGANLKD
jgi:hypothetical protein